MGHSKNMHTSRKVSCQKIAEAKDNGDEAQQKKDKKLLPKALEKHAYAENYSMFRSIYAFMAVAGTAR